MNTATNRPDISLTDQLIAAQDWWRDSGVDQVFHDAPTALLAEVETHKPSKKNAVKASSKDEREPSVPAIDVASLPSTLASFQQWWLDQSTQFPGATSRRVAPIGGEGAKLMLLVPMPEAEDDDALMSGPQGVLLLNILRALDVSVDETYFASALPSHMPMPDWADLDNCGLGIITRHHISLAKPQRVLSFGGALAQLLGLEAGQIGGNLTLASAQTPLMATRAPEHLLSNARQRARFWHNLLQWTQPQ